LSKDKLLPFHKEQESLDELYYNADLSDKKALDNFLRDSFYKFIGNSRN